MMKIIAAGFQHETNTFAATRATLDEFKLADAWPGLLRGEEVRPGLKGMNIPLAGFIDAVDADEAAQIALTPCLGVGGTGFLVSNEAFEHITAIILDGIAAAGEIDGIYLDLHGAMVTDSHDDGEGELLARIRDLTGPELPVVVSLDLHANLTQRMVDHASAMTIFRTYPHLDMAETGRGPAGLEASHFRRQRAAAWRQLPYLLPLQAQFTGSDPSDSFMIRWRRCKTARPAGLNLPPDFQHPISMMPARPSLPMAKLRLRLRP